MIFSKKRFVLGNYHQLMNEDDVQMKQFVEI